MGFFDTLGCMFAACEESSPTQILSALNLFTAKMNVAGSAAIDANQTVTCSLIAQQCSNLSFDCGNMLLANATCDVGSMGEAAASALLQTFSPAQLSKALKLPPANSGPVEIINAITANLTENCFNVENVNSTLTQSIVCNDSNNAVLSVISNLTVTAACTGSTVTGIAKDALANTPDSRTVKKIIAIAVTLLLLAVYGIILLYLIKKIRESGSKL